jgi:hypothetical protein
MADVIASGKLGRLLTLVYRIPSGFPVRMASFRTKRFEMMPEMG